MKPKVLVVGGGSGALTAAVLEKLSEVASVTVVDHAPSRQRELPISAYVEECQPRDPGEQDERNFQKQLIDDAAKRHHAIARKGRNYGAAKFGSNTGRTFHRTGKRG